MDRLLRAVGERAEEAARERREGEAPSGPPGMLAQLSALDDLMHQRPPAEADEGGGGGGGGGEAAAAAGGGGVASPMPLRGGKEEALERRRRADLVMKKSTYSSRQYGAKLRMLYTPAVAQDASAHQPIGYMPPTRLYDGVL